MIRNLLISVGLLLLRIASGGMMLVHGWPKMTGYNDLVDKFPDPLGIGSQFSLIGAIGAEVGCACLLILGLATRVAAIPLVFTMAIALFIVHAADPWQTKELAAVYLLVYTTLALTGPGWFSVDHLICMKKKMGSDE